MIPQLNEDDLAVFEAVLSDLVKKSEASVALIVDRAGYLIHQHGHLPGFDSTQIATLASNAFAATEFMANLIREDDFSGMYQQGSKVSTLTLNLGPSCLLFIAFGSHLSAGAVKYFASEAVAPLVQQLECAAVRSPEGLFDPADLNLEDVRPIFRREKSE